MKRGGHEDGMICSVGAHIAYRIGTYTCMPYVYNWSQDVEKCTLDLVLSSCTRTNAAKAIAMASKERQKSLLDPLPLHAQELAQLPALPSSSVLRAGFHVLG